MKHRFTLLLVVLAILPLNLLPQDAPQTQPQKRIALVIGNGNYISSILANPENDARSMATVLQQLGFIVYKYENLGQSQMKRAIDDFGLKLKGNDVGLFFYAGHGIQSKGYNYLIPVDAQLQTEADVEYDCVQADRILAKMEGAGTKVNIIILDACRNNPFERSWTRSETGKGLAFMNAPSGTLIAYSTAPGNTALDGSGSNSPYTNAILDNIVTPDITILQMFQNVRATVSEKSNKQQTPWESTSLTGDFYFNSQKTVSSEFQDKIQITPSNERTISDGVDYIVDSRDNQRYKTVKIGDQIWMAENLKATRYNDGTIIPQVKDQKTWDNLLTPAYCWYDNDEFTYKSTYGALYNWFTVNTDKLCPTGWHIPSNAECSILINYLGGSKVAGGKLKESGTNHWTSPNTGATDEYRFTALPGGNRQVYRFIALPGANRHKVGIFEHFGDYGFYWSSMESSPSEAYSLVLDRASSNALMQNYEKKTGFSVRCIKD